MKCDCNLKVRPQTRSMILVSAMNKRYVSHTLATITLGKKLGKKPAQAKRQLTVGGGQRHVNDELSKLT